MNTTLLLSVFVLSIIVFVIANYVDEKSWDWFIGNPKKSNYTLYDLVTGIAQFFIIVSFLSGGVSLFFSIVSLF